MAASSNLWGPLIEDIKAIQQYKSEIRFFEKTTFLQPKTAGGVIIFVGCVLGIFWLKNGYFWHKSASHALKQLQFPLP